jgi:hypothetical protein
MATLLADGMAPQDSAGEHSPNRTRLHARVVGSDAFADYVKLLGWNPDIAVSRLTVLIDGLATPALLAEMKKLINQISKERDSRRDRSIKLCQRK